MIILGIHSQNIDYGQTQPNNREMLLLKWSEVSAKLGYEISFD